jgi:hypothetical protein
MVAHAHPHTVTLHAGENYAPASSVIYQPMLKLEFTPHERESTTKDIFSNGDRENFSSYFFALLLHCNNPLAWRKTQSGKKPITSQFERMKRMRISVHCLDGEIKGYIFDF